MIINAANLSDMLNRKELEITPFPDINNIKDSEAASIDFRLGTWFKTPKKTKVTHLKIEDIHEHHMIPGFVPFGKDFILHPGCFALGVTLEWLRFPSNLAGYVIGKSSWGRRGLIIATATGVHPKFTGCLTLELSNVGEIPIAIKPGIKICQIFFHKVEKNPDTPEYPDTTLFLGQRKPMLGQIKPDQIAEKLSNANIL